MSMHNLTYKFIAPYHLLYSCEEKKFKVKIRFWADKCENIPPTRRLATEKARKKDLSLLNKFHEIKPHHIIYILTVILTIPAVAKLCSFLIT